MRSALTTLGIIIGVSAVIAMTEIGQGTSVAVQKTIASMGANNLLVMPGTASSGGVTFGSGSVITLTPQDAEAISRECRAVNSVATVVRTRTQATFANKNWVPLYIYGTTPSFLDVREWNDLEEGELFTDADVRNQTRVCLVGQTIKHELFNDQSPIGREVRMQNVGFRVIGVPLPRGKDLDPVAVLERCRFARPRRHELAVERGRDSRVLELERSESGRERDGLDLLLFPIDGGPSVTPLCRAARGGAGKRHFGRPLRESRREQKPCRYMPFTKIRPSRSSMRGSLSG